MQDEVIITPLKKLVNLNQLIGAQVQAAPFDDPVFKHEKYIGTIDTVKINKHGTYVHFKTDALVGSKWIKVSRVIGFVHFAETQKAAS